MREQNRRTGTEIRIIEDRFRPGMFASGIAISHESPMKFKGGFSNYNDAVRDARKRLRLARKTSRSNRSNHD